MNGKIKVIIADDVKVIAETNKRIAMNNQDIEVVGMASNGKEEFDMILNLKPDLVITDNKMPIMNGIEVIEKIKNFKIENKPEFVLVTGDNDIELNKKCKELNVFGVLNKLSLERDLPYIIDEYIEIRNESNKEVEKENNRKQNGILKKILKKLKKEYK